MKLQPENETGKFHTGKKLRISTFAWVCAVAVFMLIGGTFAWYTLKDLNVDDASGNVMKPYYLNIKDGSVTASELLSIGSMLQGQVKQVIFCVNTDEEPQINKDDTLFVYDLELVHTDNLAIQYEVYPLTISAEETDIVVEEAGPPDVEGNPTTVTTYWTKGAMLAGTDVSELRREQAGLTELGNDTSSIINRGTYTSYDGDTNGLELTVDGDEGVYTSQYFVLEISWSINSGFDKYEKETDMIYMLAKAVQPEP